MTGFSPYLCKRLMDHWTGKAVYAPPGLYAGLSLTDPSIAITEPAGGGYSRVSVPAASLGSASLAVPSAILNSASVTFPVPSAGWGSVGYWFVCDAATGGNLLFSSPLDEPVEIPSGASVAFAPGEFAMTLGG